MVTKKNEEYLFAGARTDTTLLVLCSVLLFEDWGRVSALDTKLLSIGAEESYFRGSQLNEEAKLDLRSWLEYVHETSDRESEPWGNERYAHDSDMDGETLQYEHRIHNHEEGRWSDQLDEQNGGQQKQVTSDPGLGQKQHNCNIFTPARTIVVVQDGSGDFTSIQKAVNHVPKFNDKRVLIRVKAGVYREKVKIPAKKRYITIEGEMPYNNGSGLRTIITYNATASDLNHTGQPLKTYGSATFAVNAKNFIAKHIAFKNTAPSPMPGATGGQAVALRVSADMAAFYGCRFYGNQDTLYDHKGRHFFKNCYVEGTIDFVFGNGRSMYTSCHLHAISNNGTPGSLTAQKRNITSMETGFAFVNSMITGYGSAYLGRAWGNDSRVVFANTFMSKVVIPEGWNDWGIPDRQKSVFYAEYNCTGPGANASGRVHWSQQLTYEEAKPFLHIGFINGKKWLQNPTNILGNESCYDVTARAPLPQPRWESSSQGSSPQSQPWDEYGGSPKPQPFKEDDDDSEVAMTIGSDGVSLWEQFPLAWLVPHS